MTDEIDNNKNIQDLIAESNERLKELACLNQTTRILNEGLSMVETLQKVCNILPNAWQYPEYTVARIQFSGQFLTSNNFQITEWKQLQEFETFDKKKGTIEVFYTKNFRDIYEGPFLREERELINNLSSILSGHLSSLRGVDIINSQKETKVSKNKYDDSDATTYSKSLLQKFLNKQNVNRDIYHDLMNFKVKEILLVANLYDAY
ncbi:MAG: hypothetical protein U9R19_01385, partial [Bacteroidota bacterium]|nr:hypothetical protein [Bacteroidota bacterium]